MDKLSRHIRTITITMVWLGASVAASTAWGKASLGSVAVDNTDGANTRIAFTMTPGSRPNIYLLDTASGQTTRLSNGNSDHAPAWSPDGKTIAYHSHRSGGWKIWVQSVDSNQARRLTSSSAGAFNYEYFPDWSPDGRKILLEKWNNADKNFEIHVVRSDGSGERNLTDSKGHDRLPSWSPDGTSVLFYSNRDGNDEIYLMDDDGSNLRNLTNDPATDYAPAFSPDGSRILFHSDRDGQFRSYLMNADGSNIRVIPGVDPADHLQDWSSEGSNTGSTPYASVRSGGSVWLDNETIVITSVQRGPKDLIAINVITGERRSLLADDADNSLPAVEP